MYINTNTHVDKEVFDSIYHKLLNCAASSSAKPANFMHELLQQVSTNFFQTKYSKVALV